MTWILPILQVNTPSKVRKRPHKMAGLSASLGRGDMVPEFDEAVFELDIDETSDVAGKRAFGYHLIHRTG